MRVFFYILFFMCSLSLAQEKETDKAKTCQKLRRLFRLLGLNPKTARTTMQRSKSDQILEAVRLSNHQRRCSDDIGLASPVAVRKKIIHERTASSGCLLVDGNSEQDEALKMEYKALLAPQPSEVTVQ